MRGIVFSVIALFCSELTRAQTDNPDCAGKTYDLFTNLEGFYIERCETAEFKALAFWVDRNSKEVKKEGKYTKISYRQSPESKRKIVGKQIVANYANAVTKARGTVVKNSNDMAYHVSKDGKNLWIALSVGPESGERNDYYIEIVEETSMQQEISGNFSEALQETGKVVLYGILFDVNKSVVKPESEDAIREIAGYLTSNPRVSIFIVGHTDNTGDYIKNIKLSKDRAAAIKNYLVTRYKIAGTRLFSDGVGPLAPVASNDTEEGKKQNRRVEIVLK